MGVITRRPLPTYPGGFPAELVGALEQATGLRFCGNRPADGLAIVGRLGEHHLRTGEVILYSSPTRCCSSPRTTACAPRTTSARRARPPATS